MSDQQRNIIQIAAVLSIVIAIECLVAVGLSGRNGILKGRFKRHHAGNTIVTGMWF